MKQLVVGSVLAAVVMFVWGFRYWGVLPFPRTVIHLLNFGFDLGSWLLAGLVLAWALKPKA